MLRRTTSFRLEVRESRGFFFFLPCCKTTGSLSLPFPSTCLPLSIPLFHSWFPAIFSTGIPIWILWLFLLFGSSCSISRLYECVDVPRRLSYSRSSEVCFIELPLCVPTNFNSYPVPQGFPLTMLSPSSDFELIIRQQPTRARVAGGKEKGT